MYARALAWEKRKYTVSLCFALRAFALESRRRVLGSRRAHARLLGIHNPYRIFVKSLVLINTELWETREILFIPDLLSSLIQ